LSLVLSFALVLFVSIERTRVTRREWSVTYCYLFSHLFYQVELKFKVGDVIYVYGDMDEDGFYTVSLYFFPLLSYTAV